MTLIQTLVTPNHIVQVSDRRLTIQDGSVFDDQYNKSVSWCGELIIGFTGIAFIDRRQKQPVSEWIAEQLWMKSTLQEGIDALRYGAQAAVDKLYGWPDRRLTIILSGFVNSPTNEHRSPILVRISNFESEAVRFSVHQNKFFVDFIHPIDPSRSVYLTAGAELSERERRIIHRRVEMVPHEQRDWNRTLRLMVVVQRLVNDRDGTVGRDAMAVSLPIHPAAPGVLLSHIESPDIETSNSMFSFIPEGDMTAKRYGPINVCGEWATTDYTSEVLGGNPDNQSVSVRILKAPPVS